MRAAAAVPGAARGPRLEPAGAQLADRLLGGGEDFGQALLELLGAQPIRADDDTAGIGALEHQAARARVLGAERLVEPADGRPGQRAQAGQLARGQDVEAELELAVLDPARDRSRRLALVVDDHRLSVALVDAVDAAAQAQ